MRKYRSAGILSLLLLAAFSLVLYAQVFVYNTFGPEFPLYYFYSDGQDLHQMLRSYTYVNLLWYRPTSSAPFYWIGAKFLAWHDLLGWKLFHFTTVLAAAYALCWLVVRRLGGSRLAAFLAAIYFLAQPGLYVAVMEVSPFDFVHILLAILCAGFYFQALRLPPARSVLPTALAWLLFVIALTAKEMALAIPFYLALASLLYLALDRGGEPAVRRLLREALRLLPFLAVLPLYYFFHLARIPHDVFTGSGPYRAVAQWSVILGNLRRLPLWILRIYAFTGETIHARMYQSTPWNNAVGLGALVLVAVAWTRRARRDPACRLALGWMLGWIAAFLVMPVYAGGFLWHINLPVVGYCVLFGMALAWALEQIRSPAWRRASVAIFLAGALLLGRADLAVELDRGMHATAFRIDHSLLDHPPVPLARLGAAPLFYVEDRLGLGPWWYGCFGRLFNYVYLRHDIEEVIVPPLDQVPEDLRRRWLARPNAFFVRYDTQFNWHDASAAFRARALDAAGSLTSGNCAAPGERAPIRIVSGGEELTDAAGRLWQADRNYRGGKTYTTGRAIDGTDTPALYQSERFENGPLAYRFCVPDGSYRVTLKFAEIWFTRPGERVFDIRLNGSPVLLRFDPLAAAGGPYRAVDRQFSVRAAGGGILIEFLPVVSNPKISAIEILPEP
ncbi:MAG TPA: malectin [Bryobacteraceae bacterium]|nr:malectin [Bryobacteraceae bacterium]